MNATQPKFMTAFATRWVEVWVSETEALESIRKAEMENQDVKYAEVGATKAGADDDSWYGTLARYLVDRLLTGVGWAVATLTGLFITLLIVMEGFWALGVNMLLVAVGPICVGFLAHDKTEGLFWAWIKAFLVFGLLYLPMLGLGAAFAGVVMSRMTTMATDAGLVYGDGSDFGVHVVSVVLGPMCAFAVVKAVPGFVSLIVGSSPLGSGAGGSFAGAVGVGAVAARLATGAGGGEGAAPLPALPVPGGIQGAEGQHPILDANEPGPESQASIEDADVRGQP
jgi:hypothetical protein